jgi:hypothetical protein
MTAEDIYLSYHGYLGTGNLCDEAAQPRHPVHTNVINPRLLWHDWCYSEVKGQILENAPELLHCAYSS